LDRGHTTEGAGASTACSTNRNWPRPVESGPASLPVEPEGAGQVSWGGGTLGQRPDWGTWGPISLRGEHHGATTRGGGGRCAAKFAGPDCSGTDRRGRGRKGNREAGREGDRGRQATRQACGRREPRLHCGYRRRAEGAEGIQGVDVTGPPLHRD